MPGCEASKRSAKTSTHEDEDGDGKPLRLFEGKVRITDALPPIAASACTVEGTGKIGFMKGEAC